MRDTTNKFDMEWIMMEMLIKYMSGRSTTYCPNCQTLSKYQVHPPSYLIIYTFCKYTCLKKLILPYPSLRQIGAPHHCARVHVL